MSAYLPAWLLFDVHSRLDVDNKRIVNLERELSETKAQLQAEREKLMEAEKRVEQLTEINNGLHGVFTHNLALQALVEKQRKALQNHVDHWSWHPVSTGAVDALSSQPDLTLIEEVRAAAALIDEIADKQDRPAPVIMAGRLSMIADKAKHILTRLNPRK